MIGPGIDEAFQVQIWACRDLGSPLYADLLERARTDLRNGGPVAQLLEGWQGNPIPDALVLRLLGGVHRVVLRGDAPRLARHYPSTGGTPRWPELWADFASVLVEHSAELKQRLQQQVQTNEVRRSAALLGGFLTIAAETGLPLRLLEIGSSAGLNLLWDRYRYELGALAWGAADSPVVLRSNWHGAPPAFPPAVEVRDRRGCDLQPIDVRDAEERLRLESFFWPDQPERLEQLRSALSLARQQQPPLTRSAAGPWLREQLAEVSPGVATVVFHSIMWWYIPAAEREQIVADLEQRGRAATKQAPFAWLQLELRSKDHAAIELRLWPGAETRLLGSSDPHGKEVAWAGSEAFEKG